MSNKITLIEYMEYEEVQREIETWSTEQLRELAGYVDTLLMVREEEEFASDNRKEEE